LISWKEQAFEFLITCAIHDFKINLNACKLRSWQKKQLTGRIKQRLRVLE